MVRRRGPRLTAAQKTELWRRWRRGESLNAIGRALGRIAHVVRLGYPFNRSKLRGWVTLVLVRTIRSPWASSRPGSGPMRTA